MRSSRAIVWRRRLVALAVISVLLVCAYWFWLRDSSLVAVDDVEVKGASTDQAEIQAALEPVAQEMTTLNVDDGKLVEAASKFPTVSSIAVDASLPHKLTITVTERLPVAVIKVDGESTGVSDDGYLLPGIEVQGQGLSEIQNAEVERGRVDDAGAAQAAILGGATDDVLKKVSSITWDETRGGVVVEFDNAPEARFGDGSEAEKKWRSLAAVVLQPDAQSAGYVDVSVPERPATGG